MSQVPPSQGLKRKASTSMYKKPKTTSALTQEQSKAVNRIARRAALSVAETKSFYAAASQNMVNDVVYAQNLFGLITQGDTSENVEGEKIFMKSIYLRMRMEQLNSLTATNSSSTFRISVIASKFKLTANLSSQTTTDIFRATTNVIADRGQIDQSKADILFDQTYSFGVCNQTNVSQHHNMVLNLKLNKPATFESDGSAYFKDKTLYLLFTASKTDPSLAVNTHSAAYTWAANFKDS